jgi:hypothetical protein
MVRRSVPFACLLALTLLASGAAQADAWTAHANATGFTISAPASWLNVTAPQRPKVLAQDAAKHAALASLVKWVSGDRLVRLLCADPTGATSLSVTVGDPIGASLQLAALVAQNVRELRALAFIPHPPVVSAVQLPAGSAMLVTYTETSAGGGAEHWQYYFVHKGRAFIVGFTTPAAPPESVRLIVTESARSFRFT